MYCSKLQNRRCILDSIRMNNPEEIARRRFTRIASINPFEKMLNLNNNIILF